MKVLHSACYVQDGGLNYILSIAPNYTISGFDTTVVLDGTEKIVHNGTVYTSAGATGIPAVADTNFYTVYE